jgi:hypothetical protein
MRKLCVFWDGIYLSRLVMFYSDRAWYTLSGFINSQNNRYRSIENPHAVHEVQLHDLKVGIWCAVSVQRTIQLMSFHKTVTSEHYV